MAQAVASSQMQVTFMPPVTFSTFMVQRGTITMFGAIVPAGPVIGVPIPGLVMPGMPIMLRSIIIALVMILTPWAPIRVKMPSRC